MTAVAKKSTDVSVSQTILSGIGQSPLYPLNFVKVLMQVSLQAVTVEEVVCQLLRRLSSISRLVMSRCHHSDRRICSAASNTTIPTRFPTVSLDCGHLTLLQLSAFYWHLCLDLSVRYIYKMEGITGLYRGLGMKIISNSVGNIVYNKVSQVSSHFMPSCSSMHAQLNLSVWDRSWTKMRLKIKPRTRTSQAWPSLSEE